MNTAIPPRHRRVLKKGRLEHTLRILFFQKRKRRLEIQFQNRRWATVFCLGAWRLSRQNNGFFYYRCGCELLFEI